MALGVDSIRPAVVAIDLHRGHLDPEVATMPVLPGTERRIIEANRTFFADCRAAGIPIVHLLTTYRDVSEIRSMPFWRALADDPNATRRNAERHMILPVPTGGHVTHLTATCAPPHARWVKRPTPGSATIFPRSATTMPRTSVITGRPVTRMPSYGVHPAFE